MQVYGQHRNPGYFDRFESREANLPSRIALLQQNVAKVSEFRALLTQHVEQLIAVIQSEQEDILLQLQAEEAALIAAITAAVQEAADTLDFDEATRISTLAHWLRDPSIPTEKLTLFSYHIEEVPSVLLRKAITFDITPYTLTPTYTLLPAVCSNALTLHNLATRRVLETFTLTQSFPNGTIICVVNKNQVLTVGGFAQKTFYIDLRTKAITEAADMLTGRDFPGVIKVGPNVYTFGGNYPAITASEKLVEEGENQIWRSLTPMAIPRRAFTPCLYDKDIYLIEICEFQGAERFNVDSEKYDQLNALLPASCFNAVNFRVGEEIMFITADKQIHTYNLRSETVTMTPLKCARFTGYMTVANCAPCQVGNIVYYVQVNTGELRAFDFTTGTLS